MAAGCLTSDENVAEGGGGSDEVCGAWAQLSEDFLREQEANGAALQDKGEMFVKGKGTMQTYNMASRSQLNGVTSLLKPRLRSTSTDEEWEAELLERWEETVRPSNLGIRKLAEPVPASA